MLKFIRQISQIRPFRGLKKGKNSDFCRTVLDSRSLNLLVKLGSYDRLYSRVDRNFCRLGLFLHILRPFLHNMLHWAKIGPFLPIWSNMTKKEAFLATAESFTSFEWERSGKGLNVLIKLETFFELFYYLVRLNQDLEISLLSK